MARRLSDSEKKVEEWSRRMRLPTTSEADKNYYAGKIRVHETDMDSMEGSAEVRNDAAEWIDSDDINLRATACGMFSEMWPEKTIGHTSDYRLKDRSNE